MQSYFRRKRYAAGNICLVLFTAFILTILFGTVGPVNSVYATNQDVSNTFYAGDKNAPNPLKDGGWGDSSSSLSINKGDKIVLQLGYIEPVPCTDPVYDTILAKVYKGGVQVGDNIELTLESVFDNVYGYIYSLVYNTVDVSDLLAGSYTVSFIADGNDSLPEFELALTVVDPGGNGGGGGGGGGAVPPPVEQQDFTANPNTPVGTVTTDDTTGTTTITVDTAKAAAQLAQNATLTIAPPVGAILPENPTQTVFEISASLLEVANEKDADLLFDTGLGIPIVLSAGTLDVAGITQTLGEDFTLNVTAGVFTERESQELASQGAVGNLASNVVNLSFTATNTAGRKRHLAGHRQG